MFMMHLKSTAENSNDLVGRDVIRFLERGEEAFVFSFRSYLELQVGKKVWMDF